MITHFLCYCHRHAITMIDIVIVMFVAWILDKVNKGVCTCEHCQLYDQSKNGQSGELRVLHFILEVFLPWKKISFKEETYLQLQHMVYGYVKQGTN